MTASQPLVIDPTLIYSTYLGGSGEDAADGDRGGRGGRRLRRRHDRLDELPDQNPVAGGQLGGERDAFVAKLNAAGTALVYSTYLGGNGELTAGLRDRGGRRGARLRHGRHRLRPTSRPRNAFQATYGGGDGTTPSSPS